MRLVILAVTCAFSALCSAQNIKSSTDAPPAADFLRRTWAQAVVIGDFLYIDGGRISAPKGVILEKKSYPVNSTLSLDLSVPWKPTTVIMKATPKAIPNTSLMARQAIFSNGSSNSFYVWGANDTTGSPARTVLSKFTADGRGSGSWSQQTISNLLVDSQGGAFVSTAHSGLYFGGHISRKYSDVVERPCVPGFTKFDFDLPDESWRNVTDFASLGHTFYGSSAHFVPEAGENGLVMVFGGREYNSRDGKEQDRDMEVVHFMDPLTNQWYAQNTTGNIPTRRRWSCTVGKRGLRKTYEIFLFGGNDDNVAYDEVYVLSLPGFFWKKASYQPRGPRTQSACVVAGQRQMITVGGIDRVEISAQFTDPDPFPQGLGIFDLTSLKWKGDFDPLAAEYDSAAIIQGWYDDGNVSAVQYNQGVKSLFSSSFISLGDSTTVDHHDGNQNSLGPAAMGGIVGGSILAAILIAFSVFIIIRRRKKAPRTKQGPAASRRELHAYQSPAELQNQDPCYNTAELEEGHFKVELDGPVSYRCVAELEASQRRCNTEKLLKDNQQQTEPEGRRCYL